MALLDVSDWQMLAQYAPHVADAMVAMSCDIALLMAPDGRILRIAQHETNPIAPAHWLGAAWASTVAVDSRLKVEKSLSDASQAQGRPRTREINHEDAVGGAVPVAYRVVCLGDKGPLLAVGHDLRPRSNVQQRFVEAQAALEQAYWDQVRGENAANPAKAPEKPPKPARRAASKAAAAAAAAAEAAPPPPADADLARAFEGLTRRIGVDTMPQLVKDAKRAAERHFMALALQRTGSLDALAKALGISHRALQRRRKRLAADTPAN
jgi:hypothetical protein